MNSHVKLLLKSIREDAKIGLLRRHYIEDQSEVVTIGLSKCSVTESSDNGYIPLMLKTPINMTDFDGCPNRET